MTAYEVIFGGELVRPWQLIAFVLMSVGGVAFTVMMLGRLCRKNGLPVPSRRKRAVYSFLAGLVAGTCLIVAAYAGSCAGLCLAFVVGTFLASTILRRMVKAPKRSLLGGAALGNVLILAMLVALLHPTPHRMRVLALRSIDQGSISGLARGLALYQSERGCFPSDLRELIQADLVSGKTLLSWQSQWSMEVPSQPYSGPCDFTYYRQAAGRSGLICIWEDPMFNFDEGGWVVDGDLKTIKWLKPDAIKAEVARTQAWLKEHPPVMSLPASMAITRALPDMK